jgi:hypothetical protein
MLAKPADRDGLCAGYLIGAPEPLDRLACHCERSEANQLN